MSITATELKSNLSKYLILSATEDVYITRNGKVISKLTNPFRERVDIAKSLFGILPDDVTEEEARDERLGKI
ncbi:MAG TPA: type II toxin-antitoxin system prevent-host-death family antitoxin [Candidatus Gallimonas intestinavium]|uniref:Type II toxin-antitoxin system prevent-host-death family antitoxin n=1 Tax=Candidatus Gallimonas intestinavium TaxID=2838603 RepID=A0A9D2G432_9FIRM|nr:type II toxin-antitoxin system prevent-host-death family antitoxin [Candidatus Gallimonas intestinavium]